MGNDITVFKVEVITYMYHKAQPVYQIYVFRGFSRHERNNFRLLDKGNDFISPLSASHNLLVGKKGNTRSQPTSINYDFSRPTLVLGALGLVVVGFQLTK